MAFKSEEDAPEVVVEGVEATTVAEVSEEEDVAATPTPTKEGIPSTTWVLYYGGKTYDCVQGVSREFPLEVYEYLKRAGNILPPSF